MNRIREIRESAEISQAELYRRLGWRQSRLANYESCNRTPGLNEAREIVAALNSLGVSCTLSDVFPEPNSANQATHSAHDRRAPRAAEDRRGRRETDLSPAQAKELVSSAEQFLEPLKRIANA